MNKHQHIQIVISTLVCLSLMTSCREKRDVTGHDEVSLEPQIYSTLDPTNLTVISSQQTAKAEMVEDTIAYSFYGSVATDIRRNFKVPARIAGRIERTFVKYDYQFVKKDQKILEIYSPELNAYLQEYIYLTTQKSDTALVKQAYKKLQLLGLTDGQIEQFKNTNQLQHHIPVFSPKDGYIILSPPTGGVGVEAMTKSSVGEMSESQKSTPSSFQNQALDGKLREGMYVNAGQTLFWINDFKEVWGIISVEPSLNTYLQQGQKIEISSELLDKHISTELKLIEPEFRSGQKFTQARMYIPNPSGMLKPNSLFTATIRLKSKIIRVPESSVYSLGKRKIVWVKAGENDAKKTLFRATIVETGPASGEFIQIMSGLIGNEEIALHAGYLLDSESLIKKDL